MILCLVVCELIDNAISAVDSKGKIIVTLDELAGSRKLRLMVEDNGPGVTEELLPKVFEAGFTTKGHGRGNGLHFVREALNLLRGSIKYQAGDGACFLVVIPHGENSLRA